MKAIKQPSVNSLSSITSSLSSSATGGRQQGTHSNPANRNDSSSLSLIYLHSHRRLRSHGFKLRTTFTRPFGLRTTVTGPDVLPTTIAQFWSSGTQLRAPITRSLGTAKLPVEPRSTDSCLFTQSTTASAITAPPSAAVDAAATRTTTTADIPHIPTVSTAAGIPSIHVTTPTTPGTEPATIPRPLRLPTAANPPTASLRQLLGSNYRGHASSNPHEQSHSANLLR